MKNIAFLPTARNIVRKYTTVSATNQVSIIQWNMEWRIWVKYLSFQAFTFLLTPFLFCRLHFYLLLIEAFSTVATNVINIAGFHYPFFTSEFFSYYWMVFFFILWFDLVILYSSLALSQYRCKQRSWLSVSITALTFCHRLGLLTFYQCA